MAGQTKLGVSRSFRLILSKESEKFEVYLKLVLGILAKIQMVFLQHHLEACRDHSSGQRSMRCFASAIPAQLQKSGKKTAKIGIIFTKTMGFQHLGPLERLYWMAVLLWVILDITSFITNRSRLPLIRAIGCNKTFATEKDISNTTWQEQVNNNKWGNNFMLHWTFTLERRNLHYDLWPW